MSSRKPIVVLILALGFVLAACGGDSTGETTSSTPETTTTSEVETTTTEPSTTTTAPESTTTSVPAIDTSTILGVFQSYFDAIAVKDYDGARAVSTGPANDYATFTDHLNLISPQPDWQLESASDPSCCETVQSGDLFGAEVALSYGEANGTELNVANPIVDGSSGGPLLVEWGVDLGSGVEQPPMSDRLKNLHVDYPFDPVDPNSCSSVPLWAYVPGGAETSEVTRIIVIGTMCSSSRELQPDPNLTKLYTADGSLEIAPSTMLWNTGPAPIPSGTTGVFLIIFEVPSAQVGENLKVESQFAYTDLAAWSIFEAEIGPFDLG